MVSFKSVTEEQTCGSPVTPKGSHCGSFVLMKGDLGTAPWLCYFVDSGDLCGGALKN